MGERDIMIRAIVGTISNSIKFINLDGEGRDYLE